MKQYYAHEIKATLHIKININDKSIGETHLMTCCTQKTQTA